MNNTWKLSYTDSLRALTLDQLDAHIAAFRRGNLADFAQDAQAMEEHDDVLKNVIAKRKKAVARHGYEILTLDDSPEAQAHKAALQKRSNAHFGGMKPISLSPVLKF